MSQAGSFNSGGGGGGGTDIRTITGNDGIPESPDAAHNFNFLTANSTLQFTGSSHTETLDFGLINLLLGSIGSSISTAGPNVGIGINALGAIVDATSNYALGLNALASLTNGGLNIAIGTSSMISALTSSRCIALGGSLTALTAGVGNIAIGDNSLNFLLTGSRNICLGISQGNNYTSSESDNILINNLGVTGESNVIRIGTQGTGSDKQNQCYLAGVLNTVSGRVVPVTTVVFAQSPYTTLITDDVIIVTSLGGAITIAPLASPVTGTRYVIKDGSGDAAVNNITISPSGKTIDGASSFVIASNYGSVSIVYNGTEWSVF